MRRPRCLIVAALSVVVCTPWAAWGQVGGTSSASGMFGSRTMGQAVGGASRSFSGSGMGTGTGLGSGTGMGSGMGMGTSGFSNSQFRFSNRQQGEFVGADLRDINPGLLGGLSSASGGTGGSGRSGGMAGSTGLGSSLATGATGAASPLGGSMGRRGGNSSGRYGRRSSSGAYGGNTGMLLGLDLDFEVDAPPDATLSSAVTQRLGRSMRLPAGAPLAVSVQGGTAVLRGSVATSHDRALAEQLVLLEPGIVRVANELQVAPNGATVGKAQAPGSSPGSSAVLPPR